jgi:hypothetical protein
MNHEKYNGLGSNKIDWIVLCFYEDITFDKQIIKN